MQCPFCDSQCTPAEVRFLADDTLRGDPVLGPQATVRFRPVRFTPDATAIAPDGGTSVTPACPTCRAAWHPAMRLDPTPPVLDVGPKGIPAAVATADTGVWTLVRDALPSPPMHHSEPEHQTVITAELITCTLGATQLHFVLTTRDGSTRALANTLDAASAAKTRRS